MWAFLRQYTRSVIAFMLFAMNAFAVGCQFEAATLPAPTDHEVLVYSSANDHYILTDLQGNQTDITQALGTSDVDISDTFRDPAIWSPSGKYIVFRCRFQKEGPWMLCIEDVGKITLKTLPLPQGGATDEFTWSIDEKSLLFVWSNYPRLPGIMQIDLATGQQSLLSQLLANAYLVQGNVSWSPDRTRIAFITSPPTQTWQRDYWWRDQDLYVQNLDGSTRELIFKDAGGNITWSPDGKEIAFNRDSICWIVLEERRTNCISEQSGELAWSPDGQSIVFVTKDDIDVVDVHSQRVRTIFHHSGEGGIWDLTWSPDGKYLAYTVCCCMRPNKSCEIYFISSDGSKHWQLTKNQVPDEHPVWQPIVTVSTPTQ
ncbi:MAG: hypothetical protein WCF84_16630 [Anaerolineae bacterium]